MTNLEQHLTAHWPTVHTHSGLHWTHMYRCKCEWMPSPDDHRPIGTIHAAHVADAWREARTVRTVEAAAALPVGTIVKDANGKFLRGNDGPDTSHLLDLPAFHRLDARGRCPMTTAALSRSCLARVWSCRCGTTLHRRDDLGERAWLARIADHTHHCKEARA